MCTLVKYLHVLLDNVREGDEENAKEAAVTGLKLMNDQPLETFPLLPGGWPAFQALPSKPPGIKATL